jgi:hypothetical protein
MKKNIIMKFVSGGIIAAALLTMVFTAIPVSAAGLEGRGGPGGQGGFGGSGIGGNLSTNPLTTVEINALKQALLEEYGALNTYNAVIDQFGAVYPFVQIVQSEQQHVNALLRLADRYGIIAPVNPGLTNLPGIETLTEACKIGVSAEIADADLYTQIMKVTTHTDVLRVYSNLQSASLNMHLTTFEACAN